MALAALSYKEPDIVTILIQSSFLLLLNLVNWILDNAIYSGLVGQVSVGIVWGVPGANWLSDEVQHTVMQLGYLGLISIVYEGGLSTSFTALWSNLYLSALVAIIGISAPVGLSFVLQKLLHATPLQAFAAGAALCSTSLGTTFTVLSTSGLDKSRLGVILSSAAMLDDIAGLVMVQVISNLGTSANSFGAVTVIRPIFVSIAFAVVVPLVCRLIVQPLTRHVLEGAKNTNGSIKRWAVTPAFAFVSHTFLLLGLVTGSSYAGTSNLFAAYIAGAVITWWDALAETILAKGHSQCHKYKGSREIQPGSKPQERALEAKGRPKAEQSSDTDPDTEKRQHEHTGIATYEHFYAPSVTFILKPFFFASIGFSIPITQMFKSAIVWRGIIYTILMILGKLICGLVLVRFSTTPRLPPLSKPKRCKPVEPAPEPQSINTATSSETHTTAIQHNSPSSTVPTPDDSTVSSTSPAPQSLYPAAILGSAMIARGEIGFLISSLAESSGTFAGSSTEASNSSSSEIFLVVSWAVLLCTIIGPVSVGVLVKRVRGLQKMEREKAGRSGRVDPLGVWGVL